MMTGADIKRWRREHGYTQAQLGLALDVARQTVIEWERTELAIPRTVELALAGLLASTPVVAGKRMPIAAQRLARAAYIAVASADEADGNIATKRKSVGRPATDRYAKIVEWSDEDQSYVGSAPEIILGGCHGDDERMVFDELCAAVASAVEMFRAEGKALPPKSRVLSKG